MRRQQFPMSLAIAFRRLQIRNRASTNDVLHSVCPSFGRSAPLVLRTRRNAAGRGLPRSRPHQSKVLGKIRQERWYVTIFFRRTASFAHPLAGRLLQLLFNSVGGGGGSVGANRRSRRDSSAQLVRNAFGERANHCRFEPIVRIALWMNSPPDARWDRARSAFPIIPGEAGSVKVSRGPGAGRPEFFVRVRWDCVMTAGQPISSSRPTTIKRSAWRRLEETGFRFDEMRVLNPLLRTPRNLVAADFLRAKRGRGSVVARHDRNRVCCRRRTVGAACAAKSNASPTTKLPIPTKHFLFFFFCFNHRASSQFFRKIVARGAWGLPRYIHLLELIRSPCAPITKETGTPSFRVGINR